MVLGATGGSSMGTRCSETRPGTSKMTESHEAAAT